MQRIAAPMVGGLLTSTVLTLIVIPVVYAVWREWQIRHGRFPALVVETGPTGQRPILIG
jgi:copper/silver efflux system protein